MSPDRSPDYQGLVRRCAVRRILSGESQRELGERTGISYGQISAFERGGRVPVAETLIRLVSAYGFRLTLEDL